MSNNEDTIIINTGDDEDSQRVGRDLSSVLRNSDWTSAVLLVQKRFDSGSTFQVISAEVEGKSGDFCLNLHKTIALIVKNYVCSMCGCIHGEGHEEDSDATRH